VFESSSTRLILAYKGHGIKYFGEDDNVNTAVPRPDAIANVMWSGDRQNNVGAQIKDVSVHEANAIIAVPRQEAIAIKRLGPLHPEGIDGVRWERVRTGAGSAIRTTQEARR